MCRFFFFIPDNYACFFLFQISEREWLQSKNVNVPVVEKPSSVKGVFQFLPPVNVRLSGSFVLDTAVRPDVVADVVLEIPKVGIFLLVFDCKNFK